MKTAFDLDRNDAYPKLKGHIHIIGKRPENRPYLSVSFTTEDTGQVAHGWMHDHDLERFAVNILKALKSKKLK